jgi:N-acetylmuramoyl-L-alanine amidase
MSASVLPRRGLHGRGIGFALVCCALVLGAPPSALAARTIARVSVRQEASDTIIAVLASDGQSLDVKHFALDGPPRLVFDIHGAEIGPDVPDAISVDTAAIQQVRTGQFSVDPPIARLVVDLVGDQPGPGFEVEAGDGPGETAIILSGAGPVALEAPTVEIVDDAVLVRLSGAAHLSHETAVLSDPPRAYADITDAVIDGPYEEPCEAGVLRGIRMGRQTSDDRHPVVRVVLELSEEQTFTAFSDGSDLVLAVAPHSWALPLPRYCAAERLKGKRIVVDPGHGGDDIGAPAIFGPPPKGPFEKDIVLDIGRRLAVLLKAEGAAVTLTRDDDTCLGLKDRAAVANRLKAHALISVHCNSCDRSNTLHGTSVYYDHQHSVRFAALVQEELIAALGTEDKGVRNANFAVIRRTKGPGVLVETAYINHEGDRARLVHPLFRERAARAILKGLVRFLEAESG